MPARSGELRRDSRRAGSRREGDGQRWTLHAANHAERGVSGQKRGARVARAEQRLRVARGDEIGGDPNGRARFPAHFVG